MRNITGITLVCVCILTACTPIPSRFSVDATLAKNGGYVLEAEDEEGFYLEVFYRSYSFFPNPDDNILEAKRYFTAVADKIAQEKQQDIQPIVLSSLKADSTRNIVSGHYSIYVIGKVSYRK